MTRKTREELIDLAIALFRQEGADTEVHPSTFAEMGWNVNSTYNVRDLIGEIIDSCEAVRNIEGPDRTKIQTHLRALERLKRAQNKIEHLNGRLLNYQLDDETGVLKATLFKTDLAIDEHIAMTERLLQLGSGKYDAGARNAVDAAYILLRFYKLPTTASRQDREPVSAWCRLAAILYGDPDKNLYNIVLEYRKKHEGEYPFPTKSGKGQ
jgi:hypothetical protein